MDAIARLLSRIQFAFTVLFHVIFPSFTIGLAAWLTLLEALHLVTRRPERIIAAWFAEEQPSHRPITAQFDGYFEHILRASSICLVPLDRNRYSLPAAFGGRAVSVRSTADSVRIVADGAVIAEHALRLGRDQLICDPWHYLPVLERKPGACVMPRHSGRRICRSPCSACATAFSNNPQKIVLLSNC